MPKRVEALIPKWQVLDFRFYSVLGGLVVCSKLLQALFGMADYMVPAALLPIGVPVKQLTKLKRNAVAEIATIDHADGAPLGG